MNISKAKIPLPTFRSRSSSTRQQQLSSSLDSSLAFSERLAAWVGSNDRTRPCSMSFHEEWQHPDCKVMKWYNMQTQSSTKFDSIQHWQCSEGPFYHEYLLIKLTDGSLCRVERMGEGARADALRWFGCHAHDIIQWFPEQDYSKDTSDRKPPKLIIGVQLPQQFDILDVLAICYSIQQHPKASKYTLQRYNCYFLCSTILALLTRRVAGWENSTTETQWTDIVKSTLDDLSHVGREDAMEFLAFGILSLLDPDSQNPSGFVVESLRSSLDNTALSSLNDELSRMLWQSNLPSAIESGLITPLSKATRASLDGSSSNSVKLRNTVWRFGAESRPKTDPNPLPVQKAISGAVLRVFSEGMKYLIGRKENKFKMRQLEANAPLHQRLAGSLFRLAVIHPQALYKFVTRCILNDKTFINLLGEINDRYHVNIVQLILSLPLPTMIATGTLFQSQDENDLENDEDLAGALDLVFKLTVDRSFPIFQPFINAEPPNIPGAIAFLKTYLMEDLWIMSVWTCVLRGIRERMHQLPSTNSVTVYMEHSETSSNWTVADFQDHLWRRIHTHAQRVEQFKLAAAPLVREDITRAMSDVWMSLPMHVKDHIDPGKPSLASVIRQKLTQLPNLQLVVRLLEHSQGIMS